MASLSRGVSLPVVQRQLPYSWVARFPSREEAEPQKGTSATAGGWSSCRACPGPGGGRAGQRLDPTRHRSGALAREETGVVAVFEDDTRPWLPHWHFLGLPLKYTESFVSGSASGDPNLREPNLVLTLNLYFASV